MTEHLFTVEQLSCLATGQTSKFGYSKYFGSDICTTDFVHSTRPGIDQKVSEE